MSPFQNKIVVSPNGLKQLVGNRLIQLLYPLLITLTCTDSEILCVICEFGSSQYFA